MQHFDDHEIISLRDKKTFRAVFDTLFPPSYLMSSKIIGSKDDAADIVQEVFAYIWQKKDLFPNIKALKSYLYLTVRSRSLDYLRDNVEKKELSEQVDDTVAIDNIIIATELRHKIVSEINKLSNIKRKILLLRLEDKSYDEISMELGLSLNTVKTHKKQAYKILKDKLDECL